MSATHQATVTLHATSPASHPAPTDRVATHDVHPLFLHRWSPRAFSPQEVPRTVLDSMVEAARWAPSSINLQPWRFFIATNSPTRASWNEAVGAGNRPWSDKAPVLVWVVARKTMGQNPYNIPLTTPNKHAWFDTGAATLQFVLEGERHGLKSHYMGGIDAAKAHSILGLDEEHEVVCAIAVGYPGKAADLPEPYQGREKPSGRKPVGEIATFMA